MLITHLSNNNGLIAQDVEHLLHHLLLHQSQYQIGGEDRGRTLQGFFTASVSNKKQYNPSFGNKRAGVRLDYRIIWFN